MRPATHAERLFTFTTSHTREHHKRHQQTQTPAAFQAPRTRTRTTPSTSSKVAERLPTSWPVRTGSWISRTRSTKGSGCSRRARSLTRRCASRRRSRGTRKTLRYLLFFFALGRVYRFFVRLCFCGRFHFSCCSFVRLSRLCCLLGLVVFCTLLFFSWWRLREYGHEQREAMTIRTRALSTFSWRCACVIATSLRFYPHPVAPPFCALIPRVAIDKDTTVRTTSTLLRRVPSFCRSTADS